MSSAITRHKPEPNTTGAEDDLRRVMIHHSEVAPGEIAVGVIIGRASEYFDFFVFGIAAVLVFPRVFFPFEEQLEGTLWSFVIFSFAFFGRPVGTIVSMSIQRRWGRGAKLTNALLLLGISTVGMAFLPGYSSMGFASIVMLSILRFAQGVALGGSWDGLPSLLALNAPQGKRGWYAMLPQLGAPVGFLIASALFLYLHASLSEADFLQWGWRYTFYVAFAINVVALFARLRLIVTDEYSALLERFELQPSSVVELVRTRGSNLLIGAFAALASYALFHLVTVFPLSWITLKSSQLVSDVLIVQIIGAALALPAVIASGLIADRIGRRSTLGLLAVLIGIFALFAPWLLDGSPALQNTFILLGFVLLGLSYGQAAGAVSSNFSSQFRYTGAALTSDLAWFIGAAFAPLVALGLSSHFGLAAVSVYLLSGALCTVVALKINKVLEIRD